MYFVDLYQKCGSPGVPVELSAAIASIESGMSPLAVKSAQRSETPASAGAAVGTAVALLDDGQDATLGLMGLDARTLPGKGVALSAAFDPCKNIELATRLLSALWKSGEAMGMSPTSAEKHAVRRYFTASLARTGTVEAYEARVAAEKLRLQPDLATLAVIMPPPVVPPVAAKPEPKGPVVTREVRPVVAAPEVAPALEKPAWDGYGGNKPSGLVVFSR